MLGFRIQGLRFGRVHLGDFLCLVFIRHVLLPEIMHRKEGRIPRALPLPQQGLRFRVSGFGLRASGFESRASGFGFRVSGFGFLCVVDMLNRCREQDRRGSRRVQIVRKRLDLGAERESVIEENLALRRWCETL